MLIADKGYDTDAVLQSLQQKQITAIIPPKKNRLIQRSYDTHLYQERHKIENLFGFLKHYRRLSCRSDKLASSFLSFLYLVSTLRWLF